MSNDLSNALPPPVPPAPPPPPGVRPTAPPPGYPPYAMYPGAMPKVNHGQSIAALVLGCCSILLYATLIVPALAIVFGGIAIKGQKEAGQKVNGMAVAGLVLGIVFLLIGILFWIAIA